ncbi:MAG: acyl-CoA thioesterase [Anaerolineales bacterium]
MAELPCKPTSQSRTVLCQIMRLEDANLHGNVHGGVIMRLADEAGALACIRHAQRMVVTVVMDSMTFNHPIHLGDVVTLTSQVTCAGRTSMEARVDVEAENPLTGVRVHTNTAYLVYVALDDAGRPAAVPMLCGETDEEREEMARAEERQSLRRARAGRPAEPGTSHG